MLARRRGAREDAWTGGATTPQPSMFLGRSQTNFALEAIVNAARGEREMNRSVVALAYRWRGALEPQRTQARLALGLPLGNRTQNARVGAAELSHQPITDLAPTHRGKLRMGGGLSRSRPPPPAPSPLGLRTGTHEQ